MFTAHVILLMVAGSLVCAAGGAIFARHRGYSALGGAVVGAALGLIGVLACLALTPRPGSPATKINSVPTS